MDYLQTVKEKRELAQKEQEKQSRHQQLINATTKTGGTLAAVIAQQSARTREQSKQTAPVEVQNLPDLALRDDIKGVVDALNQIKNENKPEKVDFTPLSKAIDSFGKKLDQLPKTLPKTEFPSSIGINNLSELKDALDGLKTAVESKDYKPVFKPELKVSSPKVEIPPVDLSGVERAIESIKPEQEIKLADFRGNDIDSESAAIQYVSLIHPLGYWQIIENSRENGTLRYKFGFGDYEQAWENRTQHKYLLLDEAYHELNT